MMILHDGHLKNNDRIRFNLKGVYLTYNMKLNAILHKKFNILFLIIEMKEQYNTLH